jgi:hypothetical protein
MNDSVGAPTKKKPRWRAGPKSHLVGSIPRGSLAAYQGQPAARNIRLLCQPVEAIMLRSQYRLPASVESMSNSVAESSTNSGASSERGPNFRSRLAEAMGTRFDGIGIGKRQ